MTVALVCGISGQDGAYLARLLLDKGYQVYGTSRDCQMSSFRNLVRLGIQDQVRLLSMVPTDFRSVLQALKHSNPDEIYHLAGQSSVGLSFEQPAETLESIAMGTLNILEAIRFQDVPIRFYHAGSSECFGDTRNLPADEDTPFRPRSPYGVAKAAAFWEVANYREAYGIFACSGILFNHESPLRPPRFVTQKIITTAHRIAQGSPEKLHLGNISVQRDWGWAPEYVAAMHQMLQQETPEDYVIATGQTCRLQDFVIETFKALNLHWEDHVSIDETLFRPTDISIGRANPSKAKKKLKWEARSHLSDIVRMMLGPLESV